MKSIVGAALILIFALTQPLFAQDSENKNRRSGKEPGAFEMQYLAEALGELSKDEANTEIAEIIADVMTGSLPISKLNDALGMAEAGHAAEVMAELIKKLNTQSYSSRVSSNFDMILVSPHDELLMPIFFFRSESPGSYRTENGQGVLEVLRELGLGYGHLPISELLEELQKMDTEKAKLVIKNLPADKLLELQDLPEEAKKSLALPKPSFPGKSRSNENSEYAPLSPDEREALFSPPCILPVDLEHGEKFLPTPETVSDIETYEGELDAGKPITFVFPIEPLVADRVLDIARRSMSNGDALKAGAIATAAVIIWRVIQRVGTAALNTAGSVLIVPRDFEQRIMGQPAGSCSIDENDESVIYCIKDGSGFVIECNKMERDGFVACTLTPLNG